MKLLVILSLVFSVVCLSVINAYVTELSEILQLTQKVNRYVTECMEESGENEFESRNDVIRAIFSDEEEDKTVEKITHCFFRKTGILKPDGNLNVDAASSILTLTGMKKNEVEEILGKCTTITGYDAKATVYAIFKCFEEGFKG